MAANVPCKDKMPAKDYELLVWCIKRRMNGVQLRQLFNIDYKPLSEVIDSISEGGASAIRECMTCKSEFLSQGNHNRMCLTCLNTKSMETQMAMA